MELSARDSAKADVPTGSGAVAPRKPTDDDILRALNKFSRKCPTYVIRNILIMDGFRGVNTPWVLRQMKRLERQGKVVRVPSSYVVMLCWAEALLVLQVGTPAQAESPGDEAQGQKP